MSHSIRRVFILTDSILDNQSAVNDPHREVRAKYAAQGLVVIMRDCGQIFDPSTVPGPDLGARLEERGVGGLGLYFIRQLMDEVNFSFASDMGKHRDCNILRMVKYKENKH